MAFRRLLRGRVDERARERIASAVARRYGGVAEHVEVLEADNWLSTPIVVNEEYFVKIITDQNALVHALLTAGRNLGAFSSGTEGFFERFDTPVEMAEHERAATERMRELGLNAPEPIEAFEFEDHGVLVLEYLPDFETLGVLPPERVREQATALFDALATMHEDGLAHGDLRSENVLVVEADLYFIDATRVDEEAIEDARSYDIACGLAALEPLVGASDAVAAAVANYDPSALLDARAFLDFIKIRPDHDFDAPALKGAVEAAAA
jgi:hypothetical protein